MSTYNCNYRSTFSPTRTMINNCYTSCCYSYCPRYRCCCCVCHSCCYDPCSSICTIDPCRYLNDPIRSSCLSPSRFSYLSTNNLNRYKCMSDFEVKELLKKYSPQSDQNKDNVNQQADSNNNLEASNQVENKPEENAEKKDIKENEGGDDEPKKEEVVEKEDDEKQKQPDKEVQEVAVEKEENEEQKQPEDEAQEEAKEEEK